MDLAAGNTCVSDLTSSDGSVFNVQGQTSSYCGVNKEAGEFVARRSRKVTPQS